MARTFGQLQHAIWFDDDFRALSGGAQWQYMVLLSQPNLNYAGVVAFQPRRWAGLAGNTTEQGVRQWINELVATRFVAVDEDTEELLIRSLIRNDGLWRQPNVFLAALNDAMSTLSVSLRRVLREELGRIPADEIAGKYADKVHTRLGEVLGCLPAAPISEPIPEPIPEPFGEPLPEPFPEGLAEPIAEPSTEPLEEGCVVVIGEVEVEGVVLTDVKSKELQLPSVVVAATRQNTTTPTQKQAKTVNQRANALASAYTDRQPMSKFPAIAGIVRKAINTGAYTDDDIAAALTRLADEGRSVTVETLRIELEGLTPQLAYGRASPGSKPSTTDQRVTQALRIAQQFAEQETV